MDLGYWLDVHGIGVRVLGRGENFLLLSDDTGSGALPGSPGSIHERLSVQGVEVATHLHPEPSHSLNVVLK
jgi:hypothetical protein